MIGVEIVTELVNSVFLTGCLATDPPQSLMLISSPESGKTSICEREGLKSVLFYTDLIGSGILEELRLKPYVNHLVIRDMVMVMAHKDVTNARTIGIMMALTQDGLGKVSLGRSIEHDFGGRRAGFVCSITSDMANDNRRWWKHSGFASRMIPFNYEYSENLRIAIIEQTVVNGAYEKKSKSNGARLVIPSVKKVVDMPLEISARVQAIAMKAAKSNDEKGIRKGKQFRALARAHALLRNDKTVNDLDIIFLRKIEPYISFEQPKELKYHGVKKTEDGPSQPDGKKDASPGADSIVAGLHS
jgi:hypothetical protein